jgi:hypothetical protein
MENKIPLNDSSVKNNQKIDKIKNIGVENLFFEKKTHLSLFNYLNYFFFGYSSIFLKKFFFTGQSFKYLNKNKNTKYCFLVSFKILELPIPIFASPLKFGILHNKKILAIKFVCDKSNSLLSSNLFLKIKEIFEVDKEINYIIKSNFGF